MRKSIAILGGGESGVGTAILAKKKNYEVFVSDFGKIKDTYKEVLSNNDIDWEENKHTENRILAANLVIKSPGIADSVAIVQKIRSAGIQIISEIEFASWFSPATFIGITGSNGKTTTASLTYHIMQTSGMDVGLGGNIGRSFARLVAEEDHSHVVLELSSFQLEGIEQFNPHIAILTNLSPDHLDRYDYKYENYIAAKFRIVMNQTSDDFFIYDADDVEIGKWMSKNSIKSKKIPFSVKRELGEGAFKRNNEIVIKIDNEEFTMPISTIGIQGEHNVKNAMAASTAAKLLQIRKQTIRESLQSFQGVEHRLENVAKVDNVLYINDSKATNVNATFFALESVKAPVIWIVGGVDKGNDYTELLPLVNEKVKAIICLGLDNEKIRKTFENIVDTFVETTSMVEAVAWARRFGEKNNTVLFSPACASFDLFTNYEDRGRQFKEAVRNLN